MKCELAEKECCKCRNVLPIEQFGIHLGREDGRQNYCRSCKSEYGKLNRARLRLGQRIAQPEWRNRNRAKVIEFFNLYKSRHPEKIVCRAKCQQAVKMGRLKRKACQVCGNPITDAHHADYSKPFDVNWLCRQHHSEVHHGI